MLEAVLVLLVLVCLFRRTGLKQDPENLELRKNLLETQRQRVAAQSTARRAARPREAISEYFKTHPLQTFQFVLRGFLLINWVRATNLGWSS